MMRSPYFCMAKWRFANRHVASVQQWFGTAVLIGVLMAEVALAKGAAASDDAASAPAAAASANSAASGVPAARPRAWIGAARTTGRLGAADLGLVVNTADPASVAIGRHYMLARRLAAHQVLEVSIPVDAELTEPEFDDLRKRIDLYFGDRVQALALAWSRPYAVRCNSLTGALTMGFDGSLCQQTCGRSRVNPYLNSPSLRPWQDHRLRLTMQLAAPDEAQALALIDRGVASDGTLGLRGAPPVTALFTTSTDRARNVRAALYPPDGPVPAHGLDVQVSALVDAAGSQRVMMMQAGAARVPQLDALGFVPGALADHLTSFGGRLDGRGQQMTVLEWIAAGATASHGTVSEPCNHLQKFPHPQLLLLHYVQGSTAIEAYWRSVAWPQQSLFVGEPLAAPFARR